MYNTTAFLYEATAAFEAPERTCDEIEGFLADCGIKSPGLLGDLGSGTGLMSVLLAERGWQVEGIELSPAMLAVAQAKSRMGELTNGAFSLMRRVIRVSSETSSAEKSIWPGNRMKSS